MATAEVSNTQRAHKVDQDRIKSTCNSVLTRLRLPGAELSVLLTGPRVMRRLNNQWRGKDATTDVLSFPAHDHDPAKAVLSGETFIGDIAIDVGRARKQASEQGVTLDEEIDRLLVHGILHLLGYDHEQGRKEARRMRDKESRLLAGLLVR